jgi:glycolate oxidase iron-sulfur subunit
LLERVLPYPARVRRAAGLLRFYQRSGLQAVARRSGLLEWMGLAEAEGLSPVIAGGESYDGEVTGPVRARVAFFPGCAQRVLLPELNAATVRVLRRQGCDVTVIEEMGCCGALHVHSGMREFARALARENVVKLEAALASVDAVVVNAAGCGATLKEYADLFEGEPEWEARAQRVARKINDVTEFLDDLGPRTELLGPLPVTATYQDPCHLAHGQGIRNAPRALLATIPSLELREMERSDQCCGSAGTYNLKQPEIARALLADRLNVIAASGAEIVVTANPGCQMQLASALPGRVFHVVELLDASHRARPR